MDSFLTYSVVDYVISLLKIFRKNLFSWRHLEISSVLLLRVLDLSALVMKSFSVKDKLQHFEPLLYGATFATMDHLMIGVWYFSLFFNFQRCSDSSVLFA